MLRFMGSQRVGWDWVTSEGLRSDSVFVASYSTIDYNSFEEGAEPYIAVKVNVPKGGEYTISVDSGVTMIQWMLPI